MGALSGGKTERECDRQEKMYGLAVHDRRGMGKLTLTWNNGMHEICRIGLFYILLTPDHETTK